MKKIIFTISFVFSLNCFSQYSFQKGYYIDNSDEKVVCFIKNYDWKNSPATIEYKMSLDGEVQERNIFSTKEFGIANIVRFKRAKVDVDESGTSLSSLSSKETPEFENKEVLLKVLVEGKASLFSYNDGRIHKFFYSMDDNAIDPLVYKKYRISNNSIGENNNYKQQLYNELKCQDITARELEKLEYSSRKLINIFIKYNDCMNEEFSIFESEKKSDWFHLSLRPGIQQASLSIRNNNTSARNIDFGSQSGLRIGAELEFILPFNNNKWAIILEPTYQSYKAEKSLRNIPTATVPIDDEVAIDYSSIELLIGARHYFFLTEKSKLFLDASLVYDFDFDSTLSFERLSDVEVIGSNIIRFGFGYKYSNRYSAQLVYSTSRNIFGAQTGWDSDYETVSLIFGYTIF